MPPMGGPGPDMMGGAPGEGMGMDDQGMGMGPDPGMPGEAPDMGGDPGMGDPNMEGGDPNMGGEMPPMDDQGGGGMPPAGGPDGGDGSEIMSVIQSLPIEKQASVLKYAKSMAESRKRKSRMIRELNKGKDEDDGGKRGNRKINPKYKGYPNPFAP